MRHTIHVRRKVCWFCRREADEVKNEFPEDFAGIKSDEVEDISEYLRNENGSKNIIFLDSAVKGPAA